MSENLPNQYPKNQLRNYSTKPVESFLDWVDALTNCNTFQGLPYESFSSYNVNSECRSLQWYLTLNFFASGSDTYFKKRIGSGVTEEYSQVWNAVIGTREGLAVKTTTPTDPSDPGPFPRYEIPFNPDDEIMAGYSWVLEQGDIMEDETQPFEFYCDSTGPYPELEAWSGSGEKVEITADTGFVSAQRFFGTCAEDDPSSEFYCDPETSTPYLYPPEHAGLSYGYYTATLNRREFTEGNYSSVPAFPGHAPTGARTPSEWIFLGFAGQNEIITVQTITTEGFPNPYATGAANLSTIDFYSFFRPEAS